MKVKGISVGRAHCLAWDQDGLLYSWGEGLDGKLGHPIGEGQITFNRIETSPALIRSLADHRIVEAAAGNCISLAISSEGELFQWGKG